jgi:hypothetical protein
MSEDALNLFHLHQQSLKVLDFFELLLIPDVRHGGGVKHELRRQLLS